VAVLVGDPHFSHKPPLARSSEQDWYAAQARPIGDIEYLAEKYGVPIICVGDVFDRWNAPAELINFLLGKLSKWYCIAGQHDLPNHNYRDIARSAYWTLVKAGKVINLGPHAPLELGRMRLWGFPWGYSIGPPPTRLPHDLTLEVAVVHSYLWTEGKSYPGARPDDNVKVMAKKLKGYDVAVWGDNHTPFDYETKSGCLVYNCGSLMRRTMDQKDYTPSVGLLLGDGGVMRIQLDTSKDVFLDAQKGGDLLQGIGFQGFVEELTALAESSVNFGEAIKRTLRREKVPDDVKRLILNYLDIAQGGQ
jgi:predicted phosphodiesterase